MTLRMGVPVEAKVRATDSSVPSPPSTITRAGCSAGICARSTAGAAVGVAAAFPVKQRLIAVLAQPLDQFRQQPDQFLLLRFADNRDANHAVPV